MHLEIKHDPSITIKQSFREYILDSLKANFLTYLSGVQEDEINANLNFTSGHNSISCYIVLHGGHHILLRSDANSTSSSSAFEMAITKLQNKMRKYKDKFNTYKKRNSADEEHHHFQKTIVDYDKITDYSFDIQDSEYILEEKSSIVERLSSVEAVMKMDIGGFGGLCYIDIETKSLCFVYKREDGNISFLDSKKAF